VFAVPFQPVQRVTLQVLVAGLAADAELIAQIRDRKAIGLRQHNESGYFFHEGHIFPGHGAPLCVTHHRRPTVTYQCGSYHSTGRSDQRRRKQTA